ncbi:hypothetical protein BESB_070680 [Besnoitia besnoiti]|uniref:Uncharacterized protein n=1 Tax=Besnoitia besnoiti TaxID=94643 RepID=A0A2A9MD89_BESBE|nr:uncharacterized protein BESB_070680 [Besnoitia besnoiti]PFH33916.1 hypothetical protein BESB_070680 [Besnoitia besnoiti]
MLSPAAKRRCFFEMSVEVYARTLMAIYLLVLVAVLHRVHVNIIGRQTFYGVYTPGFNLKLTPDAHEPSASTPSAHPDGLRDAAGDRSRSGDSTQVLRSPLRTAAAAAAAATAAAAQPEGGGRGCGLGADNASSCAPVERAAQGREVHVSLAELNAANYLFLTTTRVLLASQETLVMIADEFHRTALEVLRDAQPEGLLSSRDLLQLLLLILVTAHARVLQRAERAGDLRRGRLSTAAAAREPLRADERGADRNHGEAENAWSGEPGCSELLPRGRGLAALLLPEGTGVLFASPEKDENDASRSDAEEATRESHALEPEATATAQRARETPRRPEEVPLLYSSASHRAPDSSKDTRDSQAGVTARARRSASPQLPAAASRPEAAGCLHALPEAEAWLRRPAVSALVEAQLAEARDLLEAPACAEATVDGLTAGLWLAVQCLQGCLLQTGLALPAHLPPAVDDSASCASAASDGSSAFSGTSCATTACGAAASAARESSSSARGARPSSSSFAATGAASASPTPQATQTGEDQGREDALWFPNFCVFPFARSFGRACQLADFVLGEPAEASPAAADSAQDAKKRDETAERAERAKMAEREEGGEATSAAALGFEDEVDSDILALLARLPSVAEFSSFAFFPTASEDELDAIHALVVAAQEKREVERERRRFLRPVSSLHDRRSPAFTHLLQLQRDAQRHVLLAAMRANRARDAQDAAQTQQAHRAKAAAEGGVEPAGGVAGFQGKHEDDLRAEGEEDGQAAGGVSAGARSSSQRDPRQVNEEEATRRAGGGGKHGETGLPLGGAAGRESHDEEESESLRRHTRPLAPVEHHPEHTARCAEVKSMRQEIETFEFCLESTRADARQTLEGETFADGEGAREAAGVVSGPPASTDAEAACRERVVMMLHTATQRAGERSARKQIIAHASFSEARESGAAAEVAATLGTRAAASALASRPSEESRRASNAAASEDESFLDCQRAASDLSLDMHLIDSRRSSVCLETWTGAERSLTSSFWEREGPERGAQQQPGDTRGEREPDAKATRSRFAGSGAEGEAGESGGERGKEPGGERGKEPGGAGVLSAAGETDSRAVKLEIGDGESREADRDGGGGAGGRDDTEQQIDAPLVSLSSAHSGEARQHELEAASEQERENDEA